MNCEAAQKLELAKYRFKYFQKFSELLKFSAANDQLVCTKLTLVGYISTKIHHNFYLSFTTLVYSLMCCYSKEFLKNIFVKRDLRA